MAWCSVTHTDKFTFTFFHIKLNVLTRNLVKLRSDVKPQLRTNIMTTYRLVGPAEYLKGSNRLICKT